MYQSCKYEVLCPSEDLFAEYGDLLSADELAKIFRVSKQTIYKEIKAGKFGKPIQIGRAYLIPKVYILKNYILDNAT
jgi:excisionase family DNA binding protein